MKNNFLKFISITSGITAIVLAGAIVFSNSNLSNGAFLTRATDTSITNGSIVFNGSSSSRSGTTNTISTTTQTGGGIVCKTLNNDSSKSSGYVGALKSGSEIHFYENDGTTEYTFEDLSIIRFDKVSEANSNFSFTIYALYDDGTTFSNSYTITAYTSYKQYNFSTLGNVSNIYIVCNSDSGQVTRLTTITITYNCSTKTQTGVEVSNAPTKTTYEEGEIFDPSGMIVKAVYSNGSKVATDYYTYSPTLYLSTSDEFITVYFGLYSTTYPITVNPLPELTGIYIDTAPTKTSYYVDDVFDPTGMVVKGHYSDSVDRVINGYTYSPSGSLNTDDDEITISFGGFNVSQSISVSENSFAGTYQYISGSSTYTVVIVDGTTGYYHYTNSLYSYDYMMHFTYSVSGTTVTFNKDAQAGDSQMDTGSYYNLFTNNGSYNTSNTGTTYDGGIKIYTCSNTARTSTAKNCAKQ